MITPTRDDAAVLAGVRRLVFLNSAADAGEASPDTDYVILDTAWTPVPGERADLLPIRPALWEVIRDHDLHQETLAALDEWADRAGMVARLQVSGVSWWYHVRGFLRLDLHEMILWRRVLDVVAPPGRYGQIEVPSDRPHLRAALEAAATVGTSAADVVVRQALTDAPRFRGGKPSLAGPGRRRPWYRRIISKVVRVGSRALNLRARARARLVRERFGRMVHRRHDVLAIVRGDSFHVVEQPDGEERSDPIVGPVLRALTARGRSTTVVVLGAVSDELSEQSVHDDAPMPMTALTNLLTDRRERVDDLDDLARRLAGIEAFALPVAGVDLAPALVDVLGSLDQWFARQLRELLVAKRLMATLRPRALVTGWEAARTAWLEAARSSGVPVVAIQHGVIYPKSPDYYRPGRQGLVLPDLMCVFGPYERRLLVEECGYQASRVLATGSPRVTEAAAASPLDQDEREDVRRSLGVSDGDRVLLISGARHAVGEGLLSTTILAGLLAGELPGVHLVFKLHPEEEQGDHYPALVDGLARAGRYPAPPVTVVRHADVFRLLRASDAHLGVYSTVLTDAVLAGTPNMVAVGAALSDLVGYARAGVARPVSSVDDVRAFMRDPQPPTADARRAFLREHFEPGNGAERAADAIARLADRRARS